MGGRKKKVVIQILRNPIRSSRLEVFFTKGYSEGVFVNFKRK